MTESRIRNAALRSKIMSADEAAALIPDGAQRRHERLHRRGLSQGRAGRARGADQRQARRGEQFKIGVWTGASTAPELDGALAKVDGIELRLPYQSDPTCRKRINAGEMEYIDIHLSHVAQFVWFGFLGKLDIAVVEVAGIREDGRLIPSSSVGNNKTWLDQADKIILEVNSWQNPALEGMHDIYYGTDLPPHRQPIPLVTSQRPDRRAVFLLRSRQGHRRRRDRLARPQLGLLRARRTPRAPSPATSSTSSDHEVKRGRLPPNLLPLQSGVGNIANAVMAGLQQGPFDETDGLSPRCCRTACWT